MNTDKIYAESIVNEYSIKDDRKAIALKKLDNKVKLPPLIFTYSYGIISVLILGVGMCLAMEVIGDKSTEMFIVGIIVGILGIIGISTNYSIYKMFLNSRKKKYANDIISLAKEITNE